MNDVNVTSHDPKTLHSSWLIGLLLALAVTEREILYGILKVPETSGKTLWFKRNIKDIEQQEKSKLLSRYIGNHRFSSGYHKMEYVVYTRPSLHRPRSHTRQSIA